MKKTIYIAGKVTGEPMAECSMKFGAQEKALKDLGFQAINPLTEVVDYRTPWNEAMKICIKSLMTADAVLALPCSANSKGAQLEIKLCADLGIPVFISVETLKKAFKKN